MTEQERQNWSNVNKANLFVANEFYHHHSFEIIKAYKELQDNFRDSLSNVINMLKVKVLKLRI